MKRRRVVVLWCLAAIAVVVAHVTLGVLRGSLGRVSGDEGTFLAMTESLVRDGDLRFDAADRSRIEADERPGAGTLILQRVGETLSYSKPIVYPLIAAPFLAAGGERGLAVLNVLALLAAAAVAWRELSRTSGAGRSVAAYVVLTGVGVGVVPSYVAFRTSDLLQAALVLAGTAWCCGVARAGSAGRLETGTGADREELGRAAAGGVALGLAGVARYPNLLALAAAVGCLAVTRRWRAAATTALAGLLAVLSLSAVGARLTGTANPYKAERASFDGSSGYPDSARSAVAETGFGARLATQGLEARPVVRPRVSAWAAVYYFVGRHTGLLFYFPAAVVLGAAALRRSDRVGGVLLAAAVVGMAFFVIWMPRNYFGGSTFVGNRYFLTLLPLLLLAPRRLPGARSLSVVWAIGVVVWVSAVLSIVRVGDLDRSSQSHAYAGVFPLLPYESTARTLDGWRDRYWQGTFWRFTDPWATAGEMAFELEPGRPAAETILASRGPKRALRLAVRSDVPAVVLEVSQHGRASRVRADTSGPGGRGVVELPLAPAWRRHPFWWAPGVPYDVRALRWRVVDGGAARVRLLGFAPSGEGP